MNSTAGSFNIQLMHQKDEFDHFIRAQDRVYDDVLQELKSGRKQSHWMWVIFPQLEGLGRSSTSRSFSLNSLETAARYAAHPVLGRRLRECTQLVLGSCAGSARDIFGSPDHLKFHSSMTLFRLSTPDESLFREALKQFYAGEMDAQTLLLLGKNISR